MGQKDIVLMEIYLAKTPSGHIIGATEQDCEKLSKVKANTVIRAQIKKMRNGALHRKFFALLNLVFANQDHYKEFNHLLTDIKLRVGHYEEVVKFDGELMLLPKSINFDSMEDYQFQEFYSRVTAAVIHDYYYDDIAESELENQVMQRLSFSS